MKRSQTFSRLLPLTLVLLLVAVQQVSQAAKFNRVRDIGDPAPRWESLPGVDGENHSFDEYSEAKALVVVFTCNHCPIAGIYKTRMRELMDDYRDRGVRLVAISVSREPQDSLEKAREKASEENWQYDYLVDLSQKIGREYGASNTPHFFVLTPERKIAYMGAFDDNLTPSKVKHRYVRDALDAVLAGETPEVQESRPSGCPIEYARTQ